MPVIQVSDNFEGQLLENLLPFLSVQNIRIN